MVIEYELTKEDMLAVNVYHSEHSPSARRTRLIVGIIVVAVILLAINNAGVEEPAITLILALISLISFAIAMFTYPVLQRWLIKKAVAKADREGRFKLSLGKQELTLTLEALILKTPISESRTSWSAVEKIVETEQHVFIYTSAVTAFVVPRRVFPDESAYREFVETARRFHKL